MKFRTAASLALVLVLTACATTSSAPQPTALDTLRFKLFYSKLREEAAQKGYNPKLLDAAFGGDIKPVGAVLAAEKKQPELVRTFAEYTGAMLSQTRITTGVSKLGSHKADLSAAYTRTGVSPSVIVALWGMETSFGKVQGEHPVIPALATLAWKSPRGAYFRKETFAALDVLKKAKIEPQNLQGSWAGAMGQCQFMPSSYLAYATDGDGDGRADIWNNEADVFASAATYLSQKGWQKGMPWRYALADTFNAKGLDLNERGLSPQKPYAYWKARGFKLPAGQFVSPDTQFRYYKPQAGGPAYLLGPNFSVILSWNNSSYFAWSVLALAETMATEVAETINLTEPK